MSLLIRISALYSCKQQSFRSACTQAQSDLRLRLLLNLYSLMQKTKVSVSLLICSVTVKKGTDQPAHPTDRREQEICRSASSSTQTDVNNKCADQPAHPHRQTLTTDVQISLLIHIVWCNQQMCRSASSSTQTDLNKNMQISQLIHTDRHEQQMCRSASSSIQTDVNNKCADQPAHSHSLV